MSGKGSKRRQENYQAVIKNWDNINWKSKPITRVVTQGQLHQELEKTPNRAFQVLPYIGDTWWYEIY